MTHDLHLADGHLHWGGGCMEVTLYQYRALNVLMAAYPHFVSRRSLARFIWTGTYQPHDERKSVQTLFARVRRALAEADAPFTIIGLQGQGYKLERINADYRRIQEDDAANAQGHTLGQRRA